MTMTSGEALDPARVRPQEHHSELDPATYYALTQYGTDLVTILEQDGTVRFVSPSYERTLGYRPEELIGTNGFSRVHPDDLEVVRAAFATALEHEGSPVTAQFRYRHAQGEWRVLESTGTNRLLDPVVHGFIVNSRDITAHVEAEELLEQRVRERTGELSTMLEVSRNVASTLELQPLLGLILDQLKTIVDYADAGLLQLDGDFLQAIGYRGPVPEDAALQLRFRIIPEELSWDVIKNHQTVVVDDVRGTSPLARKYQHAVGDQLTTTFAYVRSFMSIPMMLKDRVIGAMSLAHGEPNYFTAEHAAIAFAMAQQAAIAIENARLYTRAQEVATLEERQRLARELHDSVTQGLFSMTLHARSIQLQLERDGIPPDSRIAIGIRQLNDLTQGALAEMRALIFELRPGALQEEGLTAALRKHAAALSAREEIRIEVHAPVDRVLLSQQAEEQLYRLAQEALHNAVKHAHAACIVTRVELLEHGDVRLEVSDNGVGFVPSEVPPGHLGLLTMSDRARMVGGKLTTDSVLGRGTTISITVPNAVNDQE